MAIFLPILPNMENVIFKSVHKTTLELHFLNLVLKVIRPQNYPFNGYLGIYNF